ncbi:MAG: hypothetical protein U0172_12305 [Nitrospiraceae bacterium]
MSGVVRAVLAVGALVSPCVNAAVFAAPPAQTKEYSIHFDASKLEPPTFWQVPGVTQEIANNDPDSTDALRTEHPKTLQLKPGTYWYGTWTFSFKFTVTLDGRLEYDKTLDQCVRGRGTQTLEVLCRRMYPYGGQREY